MKYSSERIYQIWAYNVSHSFLIVRSPRLFVDNDNDTLESSFNIDMEFWGVGYLELPDILHGVVIKELKKGIPKRFHKYRASLGYKVFQITSQDNYFYVVSAGLRVGKNRWINENRIHNPSLIYDEIIMNL